MKVENDLGYLEGVWAGERIVMFVEKTTYKTLENAAGVKRELVNNFEQQFGYSREMPVEKFDYNYSYNVGFLDALEKALKKQKEDESGSKDNKTGSDR